MRTMKASEFKAKCLKVLDEVQATGEPVQVTKRGKVIAELRATSPDVAANQNGGPLQMLRSYFPDAGMRNRNSGFDIEGETETDRLRREERIELILSPRQKG